MSGTPLSVNGQLDHVETITRSTSAWKEVDVQFMMQQMGGDPSLDEVINTHIGERTKFILPQGEYRVENKIEQRDFEELIIEGAPSATIKITDPDLEYVFITGARHGTDPDDAPTRCEFHNLTFDITADGVGPVLIRNVVSHTPVLDDIRVKGKANPKHINKLGTIAVAATAWSGRGYVNVHMPDGCHYEPDRVEHDHPYAQTDFAIGFNSQPDHRGTIRLVDCRIEDWTNNGAYLKGAEGKYIIEGGTFKNNGNGNIRLGKNDVARDAHIILDDMSNRQVTGNGIWLQEGPCRVEGCRIDTPDITNDVIRLDAMRATIRDCEIVNGDPDDPSKSSHKVFEVKNVDEARENDELKNVLIDNVDVVDHADGSNIAFGGQITAPGVTFRRCHYRCTYSGQNTRHALGIEGHSCTVEDCRIDLTGGGEAITLNAPWCNIRNNFLRGLFVCESNGRGYDVKDNRLGPANLVGFTKKNLKDVNIGVF